MKCYAGFNYVNSQSAKFHSASPALQVLHTSIYVSVWLSVVAFSARKRISCILQLDEKKKTTYYERFGPLLILELSSYRELLPRTPKSSTDGLHSLNLSACKFSMFFGTQYYIIVDSKNQIMNKSWTYPTQQDYSFVCIELLNVFVQCMIYWEKVWEKITKNMNVNCLTKEIECDNEVSFVV